MPIDFLDQCWCIVSLTLKNKPHAILIKIQNSSFTKMHPENIICHKASILFWEMCSSLHSLTWANISYLYALLSYNIEANNKKVYSLMCQRLIQLTCFKRIYIFNGNKYVYDPHLRWTPLAAVFVLKTSQFTPQTDSCTSRFHLV